MNNIKSEWRGHIKNIEKNYSMALLTGKSLSEWFEPLIESITEEGAIPYLLDTKERYRASPLASTISWLEKFNLLPMSVLSKMQQELINLRDNNVLNDSHQGNDKKLPEDSDGWSIGEGVSVWSTSCAIEALLDSQGNGVSYASQFKSSILWLANQRDVEENAWAYQLSDNCEPNVIMTSLALRTLALAYKEPNRSVFNFTENEIVKLERAIQAGYTYLKQKCVHKNNKVYWCFNQQPHCAATTWALLALKWVSLCKSKVSEDCRIFYKRYREAALFFVCSKIPSKIIQWEDEPFVYEGGAKYGKQKNYVSFSATLLPQLFELGVSPFHPKVVNQIKWLLANPEEWKINTYDKGKICYFTYAMVIATIISWIQQVGIAFASVLLKQHKKRFEKIIFGYDSSRILQVQLIKPNRITIASCLFTFVLLLLLFGEQVENFTTWILSCVISTWISVEDYRIDVLIGIISNFLQAAIAYVFVLIIKWIKKGVQKWRND